MDTLPSLLSESESQSDIELNLFSERLNLITSEREKLSSEELRVMLSLSTGAQSGLVQHALKISAAELKRHTFSAQAKIGKV